MTGTPDRWASLAEEEIAVITTPNRKEYTVRAKNAFRAAQLAVAMTLLSGLGCSPDPHTIGRIGEISGNVSWERGSEADIALSTNAIVVTPVTVSVTPSSTPGTFGSTVVTKINGTTIHFGSRSTIGSRVTIPYSVSLLPADVAIQLEMKTNNGGITFVRAGTPVDAICTIAQPSVTGFDFVPSPALK